MGNKIKIIIVTFIINMPLIAQPTFTWAKSFGGFSSDYGLSIAIGKSGNVYSTGFYNSSMDVDPGPGVYNFTGSGRYVQKLSAAGNFIWAKEFGDGNGSFVLDNHENLYFTGIFSGTSDFDPDTGVFNLTSAGSYDIYVNKLDSSGNFLWAKRIGGTDFDIVTAIDIDSSSNIYITGKFSGTADFDPGSGIYNMSSVSGSPDIFVCKLDKDGNFVWAIQIGNSGTENGSAIKIDSHNNVVVVGSFFNGSMAVDFDPGSGTNNMSAIGDEDVFISKFDLNGNFLWAKQYGGPSDSVRCNTIAIDENDNIICTGYFYGVIDFDPSVSSYDLTSAGDKDIFISKLDSSGNFVWAKKIGGTAEDNGNSIAVDRNGSIYSTGWFRNSADFDPGVGSYILTSAGTVDAYLSVLDSSGEFVWAARFGGPAGERGYGIATDQHLNIYSTGNFVSTTDFDAGSGTYNLSSNGVADAFVMRYSQCTLPVVSYVQDPDTVCANSGTISLYSGIPAGGIYAGAGVSAGVFDPSVTGAGVFSITYEYADSVGCINRATSSITVSNCVSLSDIIDGETKITIYPNPTPGIITVSNASEVVLIESVHVFNSLGQELKINVTNDDSENVKIDFSDLISGIYFLVLNTSEGTVSKRIIKN